MSKAGIEQVVVEYFIVREEQKAFAILVEPAYGIDFPGKITESGQCRPLSGELCQDPKGLVRNEVSGQVAVFNFRSLRSR
jgi:hypothetical protein